MRPLIGRGRIDSQEAALGVGERGVVAVQSFCKTHLPTSPYLTSGNLPILTHTTRYYSLSRETAQ